MWKKWKKAVNYALQKAAGQGQVDLMVNYANLAVTNYSEAFTEAAKGGYKKCMVELIKRDRLILDSAMQECATMVDILIYQNENLRSKKLSNTLKEEMRENLDVIPGLNWRAALCWASKGGHIDCMRLVKEEGAENFGEALCYAARGEQIEAIQILIKWGAESSVLT